MSLLSIPGVAIPFAAVFTSFCGASLGGFVAYQRFKPRMIVAATAASVVIVFGVLLAYSSQTNEPYFALHMGPVSGWGGVALSVYLTYVIPAGLITGFFLMVILAGIWPWFSKMDPPDAKRAIKK